MKKSVVILDFDGTIANTLPFIYHFIQHLTHKLGKPSLSQEEFDAARSLSYKELIKKYQVPLIKIPFFMIEGRMLMNQHIKEVKPCDGIIDLLKKLKKLKITLAILSTNSKSNIEKFLKLYQLNFFDSVVSEFNLFGKGKSLKNMLQKNNWLSTETVYIGDEVRDIQAAKEAGIEIISVTWGLNTKELLVKNKPTYIVNKPQEIFNYI